MERTFVGVCDEEIQLSHATTWQLNKLGGHPDWMYSDCNYPSCNVCGDPLYHVTQMYCPLEASSYHRTLYIFTCVRKSCTNNRNSWRVFRSQLLVSQNESSKQVTEETTTVVAMAMDEWCEDADDWGSESEEESCNEEVSPSTSNGTQDIEGTEPSIACHPSGDAVAMVTRCSQNTSSSDEILTKATKIATGQDVDAATVKEHSEDRDPSDGMTRLCISAPSKHLTSDNSDSVLSASGHHSFKSYFVSVFDEPSPNSSGTKLTNHEKELIASYQQREGVDLLEWQEEHLKLTSVATCEESYEKTSAQHGDKIFQRFAKRLQLCPEQCIRYSWNGTPLYLTSPSEGALIPPCPYCGSQRVFEVQLMPPLINTLHDAKKPGIQIDFGVVLIYTCKTSCWDAPCQPGQPNLREEHVELQVDPDNSLITRSNLDS